MNSRRLISSSWGKDWKITRNAGWVPPNSFWHLCDITRFIRLISAYEGQSGRAADIVGGPILTHQRTSGPLTIAKFPQYLLTDLHQFDILQSNPRWQGPNAI